LLLLPLVMPGMYWQRVMSIVCIYGLLALSFDFLAHYVGLVSLGGCLFRGHRRLPGGHSEHQPGPAAPGVHSRWPRWSGGCLHPGAFALSAAAGGLFRHRHPDVPPVSGRVIEALDILGGTDGIMGIDSFPNRLGRAVFGHRVLLVFLFGLRRLVNTDLGLVLRAVKDNDQAVRASGMNITRYKALAVSSPPPWGAWPAPAWCTSTCGPASPMFALDFSVLPIAATVIGGSGTLVGRCWAA
jgi:branched-chain amino acid transport system permease protein